MARTLSLKEKPVSGFLQRYTIYTRFLLQPNPDEGIPGLRNAEDENGLPLLVKNWPRVPHVDDSDLREVWLNEVRELHRLAAYPGAAECVVELRDSGLDAEGFYLVLDAGHRSPLAAVVERADSPQWLTNARLEGDRALLWSNLSRIARGLDLLHLQGLLHRKLDLWSILTAGTDRVDFLLTGFEWSMRLISGVTDSSPPRAASKNPSRHASFARDWQQFAFLAARLLALDESRLYDSAIAPQDALPNHTREETTLLRELAGVTRVARIDGPGVVERIDSIVHALQLREERRDPKLTLVASLGDASRLSGEIREASGRQIEVSDLDAQLAFIRNDLGRDAVAMTVRDSRQQDSFALVLRGRRLSYHVADYVHGPNRVPSNWAMAFCSYARASTTAFQRVLSQLALEPDRLQIFSTEHMRGNYARLRTKGGSWTQLRDRLRPPSFGQSVLDQHLKAFLLNQILECLFAAAEEFPVEIVDPPASARNLEPAKHHMFLRARVDPEREELSKVVGHREAPATRLRRTLLEEEANAESGWILTEDPMVPETIYENTEWQFVGTLRDATGAHILSFSGDEPAPPIRSPFLVDADSPRSAQQLRRRLDALATLREHTELSRMLLDPRARLRNTHEQIADDQDLRQLDSDKQAALRALVAILPVFLVQGPPGVGKTRLLTELVKRRFQSERSTRMLLTAQSHHAVDHLLDEVGKVVAPASQPKPLMVRCRSRDARRSPGPYELSRQTEDLIDGVLKSPLFGRASPRLRERLQLLETLQSRDRTRAGHTAMRTSSVYTRRPLEALVLRSANLVFATSNSAELERLIEERSQFDWSVVEEAAKATGNELISSLLLSYRRLLIGDHKQLPPFGSDRMLNLLSAPADVRKALAMADQLMRRSLRDASVNELVNELGGDEAEETTGEPPSDTASADLCALAQTKLFLFESLITEEFQRQADGGRGHAIAKKLAFQHRMQPALARIVSESFYEGELKTHPEAEERFSGGPCPIATLRSEIIPDSPLVWIDTPYVQATKGTKRSEFEPNYHNPEEAAAVLNVLRQVKAVRGAAKQPSLAVLSPYREQVRRIAERINSADTPFRRHLQQFKVASHQGGYVSTVDSFQGNEADLVVVSLVRNNRSAYLWSALGFLADARRMNVLFSRARWRLVVVGCLGFLDEVVRGQAPQDAFQIEFLSRLLRALRDAERASEARIVPLARLRAGGR